MTNDKRRTPKRGACTFITAWTSLSWRGLQIQSSPTYVSLSPMRVADSGAAHPAPSGDRFNLRRCARQPSKEAVRTRVLCCTGAVDVKGGVDGRGDDSISISANVNIGKPVVNGKGESENSERVVVRTEEEIERLFSRLTHVNKNMRKNASNSLSEMANDDDIDRLLSLLTVEDVHHRRQAVQTLGMIGVRVVPKLINLISDCDGQSSTVRASCAKAIAAISLFYPEERAKFNEGALIGLRDTLRNDPDPVTRISVIGCLGSLGCDQQTRRDDSDSDVKGNEMAFKILYDICSDRERLCSDLAVSATAVSAVAQIAQNGSAQRKDEVIALLQRLTSSKEEDNSGEDKEGQQKEEGEWDDDDDDDESGLQYVEEIAAGHLEQLMSKGQE